MRGQRAGEAATLLVLLLACSATAQPSVEGGGRKPRGWRKFFKQLDKKQRTGRAGSVCSDTCISAKNGLCEDGSQLFLSAPLRPTDVKTLNCDYGTDCADCGPLPKRLPPPTLRQSMPSASADVDGTARSSWTPVEKLRKRGVVVNAAWTRTQPPFIQTFTDPSADIDVSRSMQSSRAVEAVYNLYWQKLSQQCCANGGLMLDVGANFGYYSLYAARMGCRVVAWEPVPMFRQFIEAAAALNNLTSRIHVRPAVMSSVAGQIINLTVPLKGIWGTASVGGLNVDPSIPSPTYTVGATSETLDQVVTETPCIMKLDVEGYEPSVLIGAKRFLKEHAPAAILTEYTPGVMERHRQWHRLPEYPQSLRAFASAGYQIWHLVGTGKNSNNVLKWEWPKASLPPLAELTEVGLRAEETNARNMVDDNKGPGFAIPWDLHPKSLHAEFSHNTDLLLTKRDAKLECTPTAAACKIGRRREVGVSEKSNFGLGGGLCVHVLRDGTPLEMAGRLCVEQGRNASIARSILAAEAKRPIRNRESWHHVAITEGRKWKIIHSDDKRYKESRGRTLVPASAADAARAGLSRGRGRGRGRGKGKGSGRGAKLRAKALGH